MAVQTIDWSQDGIRKAYIRALDSNGDETGDYIELVGINAADLQRQVAERTLLSRNTTYKKKSKVLSYDGNVTIVALRPTLLEFFLPGTYQIVGNKLTFTEKVSMTAKNFALYIESDAEGEFGEPGALGERYFNCACLNFTNGKTSGEYVSFQCTITALPVNGDVREFIVDADGTPFNVTNDTTPPTVVSSTPANGASTVALAANADGGIEVVFSKSMNESSLANVNLWRESTGSELTLTLKSYDDETFTAVYAKPLLTASAYYHLEAPKTVRAASGLFATTNYNARFQAAAS